MTQEELGFYNKQDKEELVIMCIARDNKIEHLRKENDALITIFALVREYIERNMTYETCERKLCTQEGNDLLEILERVDEE